MTSNSLTPPSNKALASLQNISYGARHQITAHGGNDAKSTTVVAALADLQIRVMLGREFDASQQGWAPNR
jgi:hypothetical protein